VLRLQRLILRRGNHLVGSLPRDFRAEELASFLAFKGKARRLIEGMKKQGFLGFKKGRGFYYPGWKDTITGRYAHRREEDRSRHEAVRRERQSAVRRRSDDVRGQSADASTDGPGTSTDDQTGRNQPSISGRPPDPPPAGGASLADARWEWLKEHAPTPQNREVCKKILGAMSEGDWDHVQRSYSLLTEPGASISRRNRRVLDWPTDVFLRKQAYLRFPAGKRPARTSPRPPSYGPRPEPLERIEARRFASDKFLRELLSDPEQPEAKKDAARKRWIADPTNKDRVPPWQLPAEGSP
jgi:hypothetical protein